MRLQCHCTKWWKKKNDMQAEKLKLRLLTTVLSRKASQCIEIRGRWVTRAEAHVGYFFKHGLKTFLFNQFYGITYITIVSPAIKSSHFPVIIWNVWSPRIRNTSEPTQSYFSKSFYTRSDCRLSKHVENRAVSIAFASPRKCLHLL